jgi:polyisoprenoid-binding protein YceI
MAGYPDLSGIHTLPLPNEPSAPPADQTGLAAVLGATPPPSTPSGPRTYALDPAKSSLYVQVYKDPNTIGQGLSHDHVVAATGWSGSVVWDRAHTEGCAVRVTVPVQGLVNDALGLRKRVGYDTTLTEDQRAEVKQHMLAPGQLDAGAFPTITFLATGCSGPLDTDGNGAVTVTGVFTLHGIAKTIAPKMTIHLDDHSFSARGSFTVNTTDFGFEPYTALLGALKNNNALKFTVDVSGTSG